MFKRKFYDEMLEWKNRDQGASALLIEGARRVGKSTIAEAFAKREYDSYLAIDFSEAPQEVLDLFRQYRQDLETFFTYLSAYYEVNLVPRHSVIIFDEVQSFPPAREFIKRLVADGRFDYIETGSLLSIHQNVKDIVIPSEEQSGELNPLDFEEFLWAYGNEQLAYAIRDSFEHMRPLPSALHNKAMRLLREYMLVGGMPQVVEDYIKQRDFGSADRIKRRILNLYRQDVAKYAQGYEAKVMAVFDAIPAQLSRKEKRFRITSIGKNARMRDYRDSFFWLSDARVTNNCYNSTDPNVGLGLNEDEAKVKCYMADTGLLSALTFADRKTTPASLYKDVLFGKLAFNEGMFVENLVAQQLRASGHRLFFYSCGNHEDKYGAMEIDFLITREFENSAMKARISPIEAKSGIRYGTVSLNKFKEKFGKRVGMRFVLAPKPMVMDKAAECITLPLYMAHCL